MREEAAQTAPSEPRTAKLQCCTDRAEPCARGLKSGRGCRIRRMPHRVRGRVDRLEQHGSAPDALDIRQYLARPLGIEAAPIKLAVVLQHQGTVAAHLHDRNARGSEIEFVYQQALLESLDVPGDNFHLAALLPLK